jgi:hypothetical protein
VFGKEQRIDSGELLEDAVMFQVGARIKAWSPTVSPASCRAGQ